MKTVAMADIKRSIRSVVEDSQREDVIITRHGRPVARVSKISSVDVETRYSPAFMKLMEERSQQDTISSEELRAHFGLPEKGRLRRRRRK